MKDYKLVLRKGKTVLDIITDMPDIEFKIKKTRVELLGDFTDIKLLYNFSEVEYVDVYEVEYELKEWFDVDDLDDAWEEVSSKIIYKNMRFVALGNLSLSLNGYIDYGKENSDEKV